MHVQHTSYIAYILKNRLSVPSTSERARLTRQNSVPTLIIQSSTPSSHSTLCQLQQTAMDESLHEVIAREEFSVLGVDASATELVRHMCPDKATTLHALSYFDVEFAPRMIEILTSSSPPTVQTLLECTIPTDTKSKWLVYLQFLKKVGDI